MGPSGVEINTGEGKRDLARACRGKLELTAMTGALSAVAHSRATAAVAVKLATVLATSPYGDDQTRKRGRRCYDAS